MESLWSLRNRSSTYRCFMMSSLFQAQWTTIMLSFSTHTLWAVVRLSERIAVWNASISKRFPRMSRLLWLLIRMDKEMPMRKEWRSRSQTKSLHLKIRWRKTHGSLTFAESIHRTASHSWARLFTASSSAHITSVTAKLRRLHLRWQTMLQSYTSLSVFPNTRLRNICQKLWQQE